MLIKIAPLENRLEGLRDDLRVARTRLEEAERELQHLDKKTEELKVGGVSAGIGRVGRQPHHRRVGWRERQQKVSGASKAMFFSLRLPCAQAEFSKKTGEAEALKAGLKRAEDTLSAARSLLDKLGGERGRWEAQLKTFEESLQRLPVNALLAAASLTFLPAEPEDRRRHYTSLWGQQAGAKGFDLRGFMSTESEVLVLKSEGLAGDDVSVENAICILNSGARSPLIVDPSQQAAAWLQAHIGKGTRPVKATTLHDPRFTNTLELAVRFGESLIVREMDAVDPLLFPLLRRDLVRQARR